MTSVESMGEAGAEMRQPPRAARSMRTATIVAPGRVDLNDRPLPQPGRGQVRVALRGCGVCASNIPVWEGRPWFDYPLQPGAPGHEGWGVVDAIGDDVDTLAVGDPVAILSGHAFASHDVAAADAVVKLPAELADGFPGEPLGCAMNVFTRAEVAPGQTVGIVGIGFLGALLVQLAHHRGAKVIAIARRDWACDLARRCGVDHTIAMRQCGEVVSEVQTLTDGRGCDRVFEVTGHQEPLDLAGQLLCVRGRLIIAGYHQDGLRHVNMQQWNWNGIDVINAHERDPQQYIRGIQRAVEAVEQGYLQPQQLYTHRYPLDRLGDALEVARQRPDGFVKALVVMPGFEQ